MKKKMYKNSIYLLLFVFTFSLLSCDEYLSELPDNRTTIDTADKVSALLTGAYPDGNYMLVAELMSDNAFEKFLNGGDQLDLQMFQWQDSNLEDRDSPIFYWNSCYEAISQANQALTSIEELSGSFNLDAQKGEALLARAYAHFMLVNFWGKAYNPSTANSDLGIPYVLAPETILVQEYTRNTVQEVYDFIEKDLIEGLTLVENSYDEPKFHFTKDAANAFATRFYLYKGNWDKVIEHASLVISNPSVEIRDIVAYSSLTYDEISREYASASERTNLLISSSASVWARNFISSRFGMTIDIINEYFFSPNPFGKSWSYSLFGSDNFFHTTKFEEYFKITNQSAGTGLPFVSIVLFDKDEVLLNRAEAYAMKEEYTNSLNDLTNFLALKTERYNAATDVLTEARLANFYPAIANEFTPFYTLNNTQTSFVKAISEFKRRDYYHEGMRWFDVKRFQLSITRNYDGLPVTLEKDDNRKQLQIPESAQNFGVTPNPR